MMKVAVFPNPWSTSWFRENPQQGGIMAREELCEKKQVSLTDSKQEVRTWFQERPGQTSLALPIAIIWQKETMIQHYHQPPHHIHSTLMYTIKYSMALPTRN